MSSMSDKSIPLPIFDGKEKNYTKWKAKMKGFALSKGIWIAVSQANKLPETEETVLDATT